MGDENQGSTTLGLRSRNDDMSWEMIDISWEMIDISWEMNDIPCNVIDISWEMIDKLREMIDSKCSLVKTINKHQPFRPLSLKTN